MSQAFPSNFAEVQVYPWSADDFSQVDIHPVVTADEVTVVRLSVLQLHQLSREKKQQDFNHQRLEGRKYKLKYVDVKTKKQQLQFEKWKL